MYHLQLLQAAVRDMEQLDRAIAKRVTQRARWLAEHIKDIHLNTLTGDLAGLYKLRVGDYRVIYEVIHEETSIIIHAVRHRREVYRRK